MDTSPENFEELRRLLALKRHEQPPPGYFDQLADTIMRRLEAGERMPAGAWELAAWQSPWLHRLWEALVGRPALAGVLSVAASGLIIVGVLYAERAELPSLPDSGLAQATLPVASGSSGLGFNQPLAEPTLLGSTNASIQPAVPSGLFGGMINPELVGGRPVGRWDGR